MKTMQRLPFGHNHFFLCFRAEVHKSNFFVWFLWTKNWTFIFVSTFIFLGWILGGNLWHYMESLNTKSSILYFFPSTLPPSQTLNNLDTIFLEKVLCLSYKILNFLLMSNCLFSFHVSLKPKFSLISWGRRTHSIGKIIEYLECNTLGWDD